MIDQTTLRPSDRRNRKTIVAALVLALLVGGTPLLFAGFEIVFDPGNFLENVRQLTALLQQIERATEQIRLQQQMLAHLPDSVADALALANQTLDTQLNESFANLKIDAVSVGGQLKSQYPIDFPKALPAWLETMRPAWLQTERQQMLHEGDLVQHIHDQMTPTTDRITTLIKASNGVDADRQDRPGVVAVAQAHEELLALSSGEADKLIALRAARAKRRVEACAHAQSESAYHSARRNTLMIDWNPVNRAQSRPIRNPF